MIPGNHKTILFSVLVTSLVVVFSGTQSVDAGHEVKPSYHKKYLGENMQYICDDSLGRLNVEDITPCKEFGKSAKVWSDGIKNFEITTTKQPHLLVVSADRLNNKDGLALWTINKIDTKNNVLEQHIKFNTNHQFGTQTDNPLHNWIRYDFQTTALHEIGHALSLKHDSNSNLMKENHASWDVVRKISKHDRDTVQELFS